jgi:hypothetical protein
MVAQSGDGIMADIAAELANRCGISVEQAKKGLGVVLGLLKSKLPAESFNKLSEHVPEANDLMASAASMADETGGGVVGAVKGAIGKIFGGEGVGALLSKLGQTGMSAEQISGFIPRVIEFFKSKLPANISNQIGEHLPSTQEAAH